MDASRTCSLCDGSEAWRLKVVNVEPVEVEGWFKVVHPGRSLCHGSEAWRLKAVEVKVEGWFKVVHPGGDRLVHAEQRVRRGIRSRGNDGRMAATGKDGRMAATQNLLDGHGSEVLAMLLMLRR